MLIVNEPEIVASSLQNVVQYWFAKKRRLFVLKSCQFSSREITLDASCAHFSRHNRIIRERNYAKKLKGKNRQVYGKLVFYRRKSSNS